MIGRLRVRARESGAEIESPVAWLVEFRTSKVIKVRAYLEPEKALEAAGLSE